MKKRSTAQIKAMIIGLVVVMILAIVLLMIFLFNVEVKNTSEIADSSANEVTNEIENYTYVGEVLTAEEKEGYTYELFSNDLDGSYRLTLAEGKIYFDVVDEEKFLKKYPDMNIDLKKTNEVFLNDYPIKDILVGKIGEKEYLLAITEKGAIGVMNINNAVKDNVFRIKKELISFNNGVLRIENTFRKKENENQNTMIAITIDGKNYDLEDFVD